MTPRTLRASRSNGSTVGRLENSAPVEQRHRSFNDVPSTPRGHSNKRSPTTPVDDVDDANGYIADHETEKPRVGSASKRLRGADNEVNNPDSASTCL